MNNFVYLEVELKLRYDLSVVLTPAYFQGSIQSSLLDFFGEIGGQTEFELVQFDSKLKKGIIKVAEEFAQQTRAAITLIGQYQNIPCHFEVNRTSETPISL